MFVNFDKVFNPIKKEISEQNKFFNKLISDGLSEHGNNCHNCKHAKYVQANPYWDYLQCPKTERIIENNEYPVCKQYEFVGFFEE